MAKVLVTKDKLDNLAEAISEKSAVATPLTIDQMIAAVQSIAVGDNEINNQEKTVISTAEKQHITTDNGYTGLETAIANVIPAEYITTDDANAIAADILEDKTAYVDGSKITGELVVNKYYTGTTAPPASLGNNGDIYLQQ